MKTDKQRWQRPGWIAFTATSAIGLIISFAGFVFLAMTECVPHDNSAVARACQSGRSREISVYSLLVVVLTALAIRLHAIKSDWGIAMALLSGILAFLMVVFVSALTG